MGFLCRCVFVCFLLVVSLSANALPSSNVTDIFPNAGTVNTTNGRAAIVGVTSITASSRSATVVIDARDKFGNPLRLVKNTTLVPSKIKQYMTTCLKNPVVCGAAVVVTALVSQYLYTLNSDGSVTYNTSAGSYPACVDKTLPNGGPGGMATTSAGPIPCALPNNSTSWILKLHEIPSFPGTVTYNSLASPTYHTGDQYSSLAPLVLYLVSSTTLPQNPGTVSEISEDQAANMMLSNPLSLQIEPSVYPDVFADVPVTETASTSNIGTSPNPDNYPSPSTDSGTNPDAGDDGTPAPNESLLDMSSIPQSSVDVSAFLDWGSRWLPHSCPEDVDIALPFDQSLTFSYQQTCNVLDTYIAPLVQILALFSFLTIVIGATKRD